VTIITDTIDKVSEQITTLQEQHRNAKQPIRGQLMREIRDLMSERGRLREMNDKARQEETA